MSLAMAAAVGLGGAAGALARALAGRLIQTRFPVATLLVNVLGSFLLAFFHRWSGNGTPWIQALAGAGFCGAFTTFSTFILETAILLRSGQHRRAGSYVVLTLGLCCLASWIGFHLIP